MMLLQQPVPRLARSIMSISLLRIMVMMMMIVPISYLVPVRGLGVVRRGDARRGARPAGYDQGCKTCQLHTYIHTSRVAGQTRHIPIEVLEVKYDIHKIIFIIVDIHKTMYHQYTNEAKVTLKDLIKYQVSFFCFN